MVVGRGKLASEIPIPGGAEQLRACQNRLSGARERRLKPTCFAVPGDAMSGWPETFRSLALVSSPAAGGITPSRPPPPPRAPESLYPQRPLPGVAVPPRPHAVYLSGATLCELPSEVASDASPTAGDED